MRMSGGRLQGRRSVGPRQPLHAQHVGHGGSRCRHAVRDDLHHLRLEGHGDDWITVEPLSGGEKGIFAVHLGFGANDTGAPRTGRVVFEAGTYSETYTLTQKAQ